MKTANIIGMLIGLSVGVVICYLLGWLISVVLLAVFAIKISPWIGFALWMLVLIIIRNAGKYK